MLYIYYTIIRRSYFAHNAVVYNGNNHYYYTPGELLFEIYFEFDKLLHIIYKHSVMRLE